MGLPARDEPRRVLRPLLPTGGGDREGYRGVEGEKHAPAPPPDTTTSTTPPVIEAVDEQLELQLQRLRFRGARAFLWRYREHLDVVRWALQVLEEGRDMGSRGGIRNPGGFVRWWVRQEVGDGDAEWGDGGSVDSRG